MQRIMPTLTADLDPAALRAEGVETLVLVEPLTVDVPFVRLLREAMSQALRVT
jgi:hypothetical protein